MAKFPVGSLVKLDAIASTDNPSLKDTVFKVVKQPVGARGVNYVISPLNGGINRRCPHYMLQEATESEAKVAESNPAAEIFLVGDVVTVEGAAAFKGNHYLVIGNSRQDGCYKLVKVGGDNGRYYPKVNGKLMRRYSGNVMVK